MCRASSACSRLPARRKTPPPPAGSCRCPRAVSLEIQPRSRRSSPRRREARDGRPHRRPRASRRDGATQTWATSREPPRADQPLPKGNRSPSKTSCSDCSPTRSSADTAPRRPVAPMQRASILTWSSSAGTRQPRSLAIGECFRNYRVCDSSRPVATSSSSAPLVSERLSLRLLSVTSRAARDFKVLFHRADDMLRLLRQSRLDNSREALMVELSTVDLVIVDDFALEPMTRDESRDIYQLFVERTARAATIITSNRDTADWLALFDDALLGQSAVSRFKNNAYDL